MGKMYLVQEDAVSRALLTVAGYHDGFRAIDRADVGVEAAMARCYGQPIPLRPGRAALAPGGRYFPEDN